MHETPTGHPLEQFRRAAYQTLGPRKDSLFELMEAALASSGPATLARLSLAPGFRRGWASAPDALAAGGVDAERCRALVARTLLALPAEERPVWALDGTVWPRPAAVTSPARTYGHRTSPGIPQSGVVPGWEYEWLVAVPEPQGSWVLPLDVRRRGPTDGTPTAVASALLVATLARRPAAAPRPVVALDSGYDPVQLARARLAADLLVRLRSNRTFYRAPAPYAPRGAAQVRGGVQAARPDHPRPARPTGHPGRSPLRPGARGRLGRLARPRRRRRPVHARAGPGRALAPPDEATGPLWLAWLGGALPADLLDLWRWYGERFGAEHGFRFLKQGLGWTTVRPAGARRGRPLDLAARAGPVAALAGPRPGRRPAPALGTPAAAGPLDARARPPRVHGTSRRVGHSGPARPNPVEKHRAVAPGSARAPARAIRWSGGNGNGPRSRSTLPTGATLCSVLPSVATAAGAALSKLEYTNPRSRGLPRVAGCRGRATSVADVESLAGPLGRLKDGAPGSWRPPLAPLGLSLAQNSGASCAAKQHDCRGPNGCRTACAPGGPARAGRAPGTAAAGCGGPSTARRRPARRGGRSDVAGRRAAGRDRRRSGSARARAPRRGRQHVPRAGSRDREPPPG